MDKRDKRVIGAATAIVIAIILLAAGWYVTRDDADPVAGDPMSQTPVADAGSASQPPRTTASGGPSTGQQDAPLQLSIPETDASGAAVDAPGQAADAGAQTPAAGSTLPTQDAGAVATTQTPDTSTASQTAPSGTAAQGGTISQSGAPAQTAAGSAAQTGDTGQSPAAGTGGTVADAAGAGGPTILTEEQVATLPPIRPPSFDVVRVNELGDAVIAGRAEPRSIVIIYDGDKEIGRVAADSRGEWVFVSDRPLTPGQHEIGLLARSGPQSRLSEQVVVLIAPEPREDVAGRPSEGDPERERPLALLVPRDEIGATTVLQAPPAQTTAGADQPRTGGPTSTARDTTASGGADSPEGGAPVSIDVVDYDEAGRLIVSGRSAPDTDVRLYLDNQYVGTARTEADGSFEVQPADPVEPGVYALRVDEVGPSGSVTARAETPFQRADAVSAAPPGFSQVVVQPGNSLWRIARRVYGEGIQYTVIYQANHGQIRNPDLIYPGQVFNVPEMPTEVPGGDPS